MAMDAALKAKLNSMKTAWKAAKEDPKSQGSGYVTVPDGRYIAVLTAAVVAPSQAGNLQIKWSYTIDEGEQAGNTTYKYDNLERAEGMPYIIRDLRRLGIDTDGLDVTEIPDAVEKLADMRPKVKLRLTTTKSKTGGDDFQNCYIDELLEYTNDANSNVDDDPNSDPQ